MSIPDADTRSRSATDCLLWLQGEDLADDELAFWQFLAVKAKRYPAKYIPPLKKPKGKPHVRRIIGGYLGTVNDASGQPVPRVLRLYDGASDSTVVVSERPDGADEFARTALTFSHRSAFIVFANGERRALRIIIQRWANRLNELGFILEPLIGGSRLRALIIKKGRHRWYLCDWEALTGLPSTHVTSFGGHIRCRSMSAKIGAHTVYDAVTTVQNLCLSWFGVGLSLTISSTGLRAACRQLPENVAKFKPDPLTVAMCREGGGFRGGIVYGKRYRGPAWLVDINRAYTAALATELPWGTCLGKCEQNGRERPGLYMCRITGRYGLPPIYVSRWSGDGVDLAWVQDAESLGFLCILPSVEIAGIRALGYRVEARYGMVYFRRFSFAPFVCRIVELCKTYGYQSPEGRFTKLLGNSVYGKLSAPPERRDICISLTRPDPSWVVFIDETGWPVDDMWERWKTVYQWSQHIDIAADITARVRGQLYDLQGKTTAAGGRMVAVSTDAAALTIEPSHVLAIHNTEFGQFKLADADTDGIVAGANAYSIGAKTVVPNYPNPAREVVITLYQTYETLVDTTRSGAPRPGAPLEWKIRKRITLDVEGLRTTSARQSTSPRACGPAPPGRATSPGNTHRLAVVD